MVNFAAKCSQPQPVVTGSQPQPVVTGSQPQPVVTGSQPQPVGTGSQPQPVALFSCFPSSSTSAQIIVRCTHILQVCANDVAIYIDTRAD